LRTWFKKLVAAVILANSVRPAGDLPAAQRPALALRMQLGCTWIGLAVEDATYSMTRLYQGKWASQKKPMLQPSIQFRARVLGPGFEMLLWANLRTVNQQ
jgi:hypothetical protein